MEQEEFVSRAEKLTGVLRKLGYSIFIEDRSRVLMGTATVYIHWDDRSIEVCGKTDNGVQASIRIV